jgi:ketosteroid isomerase-like protein
MSQANVDTLKQALAAAPGDPGGLFSIMDEQIEWDYVGSFPESATYHGPDEVRAFFMQWSGAFEDFGFEAEEFVDAGDSVLVLLHQWGHGKDTGARVENRSWQMFTLRDGKLVRCRGFETKAEAFEAVGLSE